MKNLGILCPIASLPSNHGIGDFGFGAYKFIDYLKKNGYSYWQILPICPMGPGWSPYLTTCQSAIDFRYISLDLLKEEGLIKDTPDFYKDTNKVMFYEVGEFKRQRLLEAYSAYKFSGDTSFDKFLKQNKWAIKYGEYLYFHKKNNDSIWTLWPKEDIEFILKNKEIPTDIKDTIYFETFLQFIAYKQMTALMKYAHKNGIKIIGDIPFYVGHDSLDCLINQKYFDLDKKGNPKHVGGVPPDYFSKTGQLWGNPCYNFKKIKEDNYKFLVNRIKNTFKTCDILRLDHFRAFYDYWEIPSKEETAINGKWRKGISDNFFKALFKKRKYPIIAEDLGLLSKGVIKLRDRFKLPGMNVFQFTVFDNTFKDNGNLVLYSGTHDNDTLIGFYNSLNEESKRVINELVNYKEGDIVDAIFIYLKSKKSYITIFSIVDVLHLPSEYRINTPGTVGSPNFEFKLKEI